MIRHILASMATVVASAIAMHSAPAAAFPERPVDVVVCTPPGGANDRTIRAVEQVAQKHLGQPLRIRYREGAGGTLAMQDLLDAQPDGYELVFCDNGGAILAGVAQGLDLGPGTVVPVAQLALIPWVFTARTDSGFESVEDVIARAKAEGSAFKAPITSIAGADHYSWLLFARESGIGVDGVTWTPFGGGGPKLRAMLAGETQIDMLLPPLVRDHVAEGTMRVLAVTSAERLDEFPDSPTFLELGYDVVDGISIVLYGPPGTPDERIQTLRQAFEGMKDDPQLIELYTKQGQDVAHISGEEFVEVWEQTWANARAMLEQLTSK